MVNTIQISALMKMMTSMDLIHPDYFDQFVAGVISWYQHQITHPTLYFGQYRSGFPQPPNLFNLFEYPNPTGEAVLNLFVQSDALHILERNDGYSPDDAQDIAIDSFNSAGGDYNYAMIHDASLVLDGYRMCYAYMDDTSENRYDRKHYHNLAIKEVW